MKLAAALLLLTCVVCLTRAADKCSFEGEEYELGATWTNECATCTCMTGKSVKCFGSCSECEHGGATYDDYEYFTYECQECYCRNGRVSCWDTATLQASDCVESL